MEVEEAEALGVEEVEAEALDEGVVEGEGVPDPLPVLLPVVAGEEEGVGLGRLEVEVRALPLTMGATVGAGTPVGSPLLLKAPLGVPFFTGLPLPSAIEAEALREAEGLGVALWESSKEGEALGLAEAEAEWLGEGVGSGEALGEGEGEGEGEPLPLPLGEAVEEMLPVAVPGGGGRGASPMSSTAIARAPPAAPRLVGVPCLERMGAWLLKEVFVEVRVEVRV